MNSKEIIKQNSFRAAVAMSILLSSISSTAFASTISGDRVSGIEWPWMKFLNSLADQVTGPLPMTLGALGIAGAAISLFGMQAAAPRSSSCSS